MLDFRRWPEDALPAAVRAETPGERGADLAIECTGVPSAVEQGMRMCRRGGDYLVLGQYTDAGPASINPHMIVQRQLTILGSWAFTGAHLEAYVQSLEPLAARWPLGELVTEFALDDVNAAMAAVAAGDVIKAVLRAGGPSPA